MKSGERVGKTGEATGWESVAAEAGKFNSKQKAGEDIVVVNEAQKEAEAEFARQQAIKLAYEKDAEKTIEENSAPLDVELDALEKAQRYYDVPPKVTCFRVVKREIAQIEALKDKLSNLKRGSLFYKHKRKKIMEEISRYGSDYPDPNDVDDIYYDELEKFGRNRAYSWSLLDSAMNGERAKENKKRLKENGFPKLPKRWDDPNFTSEEIYRMSKIAKL